MTKQIQDIDTPLDLGVIYASIDNEGFSEQTLQLIDNYINDILNGKTDLIQFNQQEHTGLCCAGEVSLGRTSYATTREKALRQVQMLEQAKQAHETWK